MFCIGYLFGCLHLLLLPDTWLLFSMMICIEVSFSFSERRGKSRGKASEETSETKHEIEIKRKSGEISELRQR